MIRKSDLLVLLGAGIFKRRPIAVPIACGLAALALGLFAEWRYAPFAADGGLAYFLSHTHKLQPLTPGMLAAGTLIAFWVSFRRRDTSKVRPADGIPETGMAER